MGSSVGEGDPVGAPFEHLKRMEDAIAAAAEEVRALVANLNTIVEKVLKILESRS